MVCFASLERIADPAKKMMNDSKFLDSLVTYDKDNIDEQVMKKIRDKYMTNEAFVPELVKKASQVSRSVWLEPDSNFVSSQMEIDYIRLYK